MLALLLDLDLSDGMAAGASVVSLGGMSSPHLISLLNKLQNLVISINEHFPEALDLNHVVLVFSLLELLMVIEQII